MSLAVWFWIGMFLWLLASIWANYPKEGGPNFRIFGGIGLLFILMGILGWAQFGAPVKG